MLDLLPAESRESWLTDDLRRAVLNFQDEYGRSAALIFWLEGGQSRAILKHANDQLLWAGPPGSSVTIPLGACLFGGAQSDLERIPAQAGQGGDGAMAGVHHQRMS
jgi:hypothetical protein